MFRPRLCQMPNTILLGSPNTTPDSSITNKQTDWMKVIGKSKQALQNVFIHILYIKIGKLNVFQFSGRYFSTKCVYVKAYHNNYDPYGSVCLCKHQENVTIIFFRWIRNICKFFYPAQMLEQPFLSTCSPLES